MSNIVSIVNGEPLTTTTAIAAGTEAKHKAVIQLARTYKADLEEFGRVAFEMAPFETHGGIQHREVALLNEQQATLLMTYMRNSPVVRAFKKRLVKAFYDLHTKAKPQHKRLLEASRAFRSFELCARKMGFKGNQAVLSAAKVTQRQYGVDVLEEFGAKHMLADQQSVLLTASDIAKQTTLSVREVNPTLERIGFLHGYRDAKNRLQWALTKAGESHGVYLDTGKKHSDGTPVRQVKWNATVLPILNALEVAA